MIMHIDPVLLLCGAILIVAFLYSSVGHAGASGYIAVMTLAGLAPAIIRPSALLLNIFVAILAFWQFRKAGYFSWELFWPLAVLAIPMAFVGGYISLPTKYFKVLVGVVLLYSAVRFVVESKREYETGKPSIPVSLGIGGGLGLLSGLTGVGGGIFLSPLLIFFRWARTKQASATSALFILCNSISGLMGNISSTKSFPRVAIPLLISAIVGGALGSYLGSTKFSPRVIKLFLAIVLTLAGGKLIFT
jgi:uncharacterized protein